MCQFESLINSINQIDSMASKLRGIRVKPWFVNYNSCLEEFKIHFPKDYKQLNLEPLPLLDAGGKHAFTFEKLITMLPQTEAVVALLKGLLPPNYTSKPETIKDSIAWYWNNAHWSAMLFFAGMLISAFIFGTFFSETTLYKKTIKPFAQEIMNIKKATSNTIAPITPKRTNGAIIKK